MDGIQPLRTPLDIQEDMRVFKATEGWDNLSQMQQRLIEMSLFVTERAKRAVREEKVVNQDPILKALLKMYGATKHPHKVLDTIFDTQFKLLYRHGVSRGHIDAYHCNLAIFAFEEFERLKGDQSESSRFPLKPPGEYPGADFFAGARFDFKTPSDIAKAFTRTFPYVCNVQDVPLAQDFIEHGSAHTFLVLGKQGDDFVVWEKVRRRDVYRRTTLSKILDVYKPENHAFFVRPMKRFAQSKTDATTL